MPDISILVPVYETEAWLPGCLDSLCAQTCKNVEIIVVNDGSPGNCAAIVTDYARRFPHIRYLDHGTNKSLLQTRITGVLAASAERLMFVDSDDRISPETCQAALRAEKRTGASIIHFPYQPGDETVKAHYSPPPPIPDVLARRDLRREFFGAKISANLWGKLFRREHFQSLIETGIYDGKRCSFSEDYALTVPLFFLADSYAGITEGKYLYTTRAGGSSTADATRNLARWADACADLSVSLAIRREFLHSRKAGKYVRFHEWLNVHSFLVFYARLSMYPMEERETGLEMLMPLFDRSVLMRVVKREDRRFLSLAPKII